MMAKQTGGRGYASHFNTSGSRAPCTGCPVGNKLLNYTGGSLFKWYLLLTLYGDMNHAFSLFKIHFAVSKL